MAKYDDKSREIVNEFIDNMIGSGDPGKYLLDHLDDIIHSDSIENQALYDGLSLIVDVFYEERIGRGCTPSRVWMPILFTNLIDSGELFSNAVRAFAGPRSMFELRKDFFLNDRGKSVFYAAYVRSYLRDCGFGMDGMPSVEAALDVQIASCEDDEAEMRRWNR